MRETEEKNVLDFLSRVSAYWASLPGTHLLVFTLVIWAAFSLVLLADARNQLNQWCFTGGMMLQYYNWFLPMRHRKKYRKQSV